MVLAPERLDAQLVNFRFVAIDMYGGAVWPSDSETGVAFGARLGFADLFSGSLRVGLELDWWTAGRVDSDLEVRDAAGGLDFWVDLTRSRTVRPYVGLGGALHSIDTSRKDGSRFQEGESLEAARLDGVKAGASAFAGLTVRLTQTGAIWLIAEYRFTVVSNLSYQEVRVGIRLQGSGSFLRLLGSQALRYHELAAAHSSARPEAGPSIGRGFVEPRRSRR